MAALKILTVIPNPIDPLSFYRAMGPFRRMRIENDCEFTVTNEINWATVSQHDLMFAQRPYTVNHLRAMKLAKDWGIPIVADYDDWLFDLKTDNPAWRTYMRDEKVAKVLEETIKLVDCFFVTTEELKRQYEAKGAKKVVVVPNGYDAKLFSYSNTLQERRKIVLWRGSNSHTQDCVSVLRGYERLIRTHKDWIFVFMNQYPWFLSEQFPNVSFVDGMETLEYFKFIYDRAPAIVTHPLSDCVFNRCKSMACFLEATHAGAAFVGPDFEEFMQPGIENYKADNPESFYFTINKLIENPINIVNAAKEARSHVLDKLELSVTNKIREQAFRETAGS